MLSRAGLTRNVPSFSAVLRVTIAHEIAGVQFFLVLALFFFFPPALSTWHMQSFIQRDACREKGMCPGVRGYLWREKDVSFLSFHRTELRVYVRTQVHASLLSKAVCFPSSSWRAEAAEGEDFSHRDVFPLEVEERFSLARSQASSR